VPPEPTPFVNSARGVRRFGFWGAFARLPTTTTPDSLQRLRCYDDDMVDPAGSSNSTGYLFLSYIYLCTVLYVSSSKFLFICMVRICSIHHKRLYICHHF
jgi:hypothetical protein